MGTALSIAFSFWLFVLTISVGIYFLPTIVAVVGRRRNAVLVAIVNTLLGWSFVGWIVALVMALTKEPPYVTTTYEQLAFRKQPGTSIEPRDFRS